MASTDYEVTGSQGAIVRASPALDSAMVGILAKGRFCSIGEKAWAANGSARGQVHISEKEGGTDDPLNGGWVSLKLLTLLPPLPPLPPFGDALFRFVKQPLPRL